ncbi:Mob1/phocein, partial [Plenodomus tracheiphilus IPT5]
MASPASPRLPSPPPIPEDQLSPVPASPEQQKLFSNLDHAAERRIRPGTKAEDMAEGPPLVDLSEIDSAFQLTEHLKALHNFLTHPIGSNSTIPVDRDMAYKLSQSPENVDKTLWLYELCRFLTQKVNSIIVALFSDSPPCSSLTCPEMRASEWQYLCAVHDPPKSCCAIDYCCHTLDWAANTLTSPKHFPSRLALGTDQSTQHSQMRQLTNIFRRVYRIFAHAWFQHRDMFWKVEGRTGLYVFFKTVCDVYGLIPEDNYTIPAEAEGIEPPTETRSSIPPLILKREPSEPSNYESDTATTIGGLTDHSLSSATTKRHRHSPSIGATAVQTVVEENEEEEERPALQSRPVTQIFESTEQDDDSESDITVIEDAQDDEEAKPTDEAASVPQDTTEAAEAAETPSRGDEDSAEPESAAEAKQDEEAGAEQAATETSKTDDSAAKSTEEEAEQEDSKPAEGTESSAATPVENSEKVESSHPAAKTDDKAEEDK